MPTCSNECTTPCNCYIEEDGYYAERPQDGRHNIMVSGNATIEDPLTFSFMHSEFFRPPAAEIQTSTFNLPNNSSEEPQGSGYNVTVYQTPSAILIASPIGFAGIASNAFSNFFMCGASATFPANATGLRLISISTSHPKTDVPYQVAGNVQPAVASRESKLSCSGFVPGYLKPTLLSPGVVDFRTSPFIVTVWQTSGVPLVVTNIKLWVSKI